MCKHSTRVIVKNEKVTRIVGKLMNQRKSNKQNFNYSEQAYSEKLLTNQFLLFIKYKIVIG